MKRLLFGSFLAITVTACVHSEQHGSQRKVAGAEDGSRVLEWTDEEPKLVYITYSASGDAHRDEISADRWNGVAGGFSNGGREDYLLKMYYANTRDASLKGIRHAACFTGSAPVVAEIFFDGNRGAEIRNLEKGHAKAVGSSDGRVLGLSFTHTAANSKLGSTSFRMMNCSAGKGSISDNAGKAKVERKTAAADRPSGGADAKAMAPPKVFNPKSLEKDYGFQILDSSADKSVKRRFVLRADYEKANAQKEERPWGRLNLRDKKEAILFALRAQAYFYENMANQSANPDDNFISENNKTRYWCNMPWLQVGSTGREAIHGLTQERDMKPSSLIPVYKDATAGSNWGVAYFNAPGCKAINRVFGSRDNVRKEPDFSSSAAQFEDGSMIAKILFTTADFPKLKDAFKWNANVSEPGSTVRQIKPVRHIQMDIAVRDSKLGGVSQDLSHWAMAGFYYDPDYDYDRDIKPIVGIENPLKAIKGLPKGFFKMRPMGVQSGFDSPETGDTILFPGAFANGSAGRLNGPADNPKSSCMGCHATAGTTAAMVPGFLSQNMFAPFVGKTTLDFNQQFALAKSNFETEPKQ